MMTASDITVKKEGQEFLHALIKKACGPRGPITMETEDGSRCVLMPTEPPEPAPLKEQKEKIRAMLELERQQPDDGLFRKTPHTLLQTFIQKAGPVDPEDIIDVWQNSVDKTAVENMFRVFTEISMDTWLDNVLKESSVKNTLSVKTGSGAKRFHITTPRRLTETEFGSLFQKTLAQCPGADPETVLSMMNDDGLVHGWQEASEEECWAVNMEMAAE